MIRFVVPVYLIDELRGSFIFRQSINTEKEKGEEMRYIAFDVETPNSANDRMSAIGVAVVENGAIIQEFSTLVNPETHFNSFNVRLTGITPEAASKAPTFRELWPQLEPVFSSGVLVAHNAPFDMRVLSKCLAAYGLKWKKTVEYACTVRMGQACFPELPSHRLNTLCEYLGIPLNHHEAGSDSRACAMLLLCYQEKGLQIERFHRKFDIY